MCLVLFGVNTVPDFPLILAANRDEFYSRPTAPMAFWDHPCRMLAGKDLEAGGTWMGISETGRFAALTNYRDMRNLKSGAPSRGGIIPDLLASPLPVPDFLGSLDTSAGTFNGFNLIAGQVADQGSDIFWYSNMDRRVVRMAPGIHGLSNHLMDTPWPKITRGRQKLAQCIQSDPQNDDAFFTLLLDSKKPEDHLLPDTGIGLEWERILSPLFIQSPTYGTRSATLIRVTRNGTIQVSERTFTTVPPCSQPADPRPEYKELRFTLPP